MKATIRYFILLGTVLTSCSIFAQNAEFVKGKGYAGYIFPKEHPIFGFSPEQNRYTPSFEDISQAEKILQDSIGTEYIKSNQKAYCKPLINKNTLKKYVRQYVGYLTDKNEIVIWLNLFKKGSIESQNPALDIISVQDGGIEFWRIRINITSKELFDMQVNGKG